MFSLRSFSRFALAAALLLAASLIYAVVGVRSLSASHLASNLIQALVVVLAAVCATVVARRSRGHLRQLWFLLAAAFWLLAAGQAMVSYLSSLTHARTATPWPSDIVNFIWVVPAAMMLLPYGGSRRAGVNWLRTLDFIQAGIVALMVYLYFFYVPSLWEAEGMRMFHRLMIGIVLRDALLAVSFGIRARITRPSPARAFFVRIAALFALLGVFEFTSIGQLGKSGMAAEWANASWSIPFFLAIFLAVTWDTQHQPDQESPRAAPGGWVASQVLPVCFPILVIFMGHRVAMEQLTIAWIAVAASFACSATRLVITSERQHRIAQTLLRTEQALRSSESMFSSAFRASPDAISIGLIPEGRIQEINDSFVRITGYTRQEVLGKTPEDVGLWVDHDQMLALRAQFRQTGEIHEADLRFCRKDGAIRNGLLSGNIIELEGRAYSLIVVRDITESKQAEVALRASEERFRSLVRDLQVAVVLLSPNAVIQFANPAAQEMLGFAAKEMTGKSVTELDLVSVDENGREFPLSERPVARAIETRQPVRNQVMGWRRRGSDATLWLIGNAIPMLGSSGEVDYVIASFADISVLRKTEEALQSSEQRFRSLVQILRVGISTWGPDGRLRFMNPAIIEMLGTPKSQVLGKAGPDILRAIREDGTEIPAEMRPVARVIATRAPVRNEIIGWAPPDSGRIVWTLVDAVPEFAPDGQLARVTASLADITNLKRAEEEKRVSQEMFSKAFHASPDSMTITTLNEGRYIEVNEGFTRLSGWQRDEAVGKTASELGIWLDPNDGKNLRSRLLNQGPTSQLEATMCIKSGEVRTVQISADLITLNGETCILALCQDISDRKRQEAELRASEQRSRTLLEAMRVGISTWGPDGRCLLVNPAFLEMTAMNSEQFVGKTGAEIGPAYGEDGKEIPGPMRPAALARATGKPVRKQVLGLKVPSSDKLLWVLADAVPEYTPEGEFKGLVSSYTDITDLKRAEEQTRISQEMFSKAFHASPDSVTITTMAEGRYIEVNEGFTRLFGWRREEVIGKTVFDLGIWPEPAGRDLLKRALREQGRVRQMELQFRTKSGQLRTILHSADVIELNGQACMLSVSDDITEWKLAQEALSFSEKRFRTLVQSLDAGVVLMDTDAKIQFANPAALHMLHLKLEEVLGKEAVDLGFSVIREDGSPFPTSARPTPLVLESGQPARNVVAGFKRPNGEETLWIFVNVAPLFAEDGRIVGAVASFADITEQKKADQALRQLSGRLLQLQDEERRRLGRDLHDSLAQSVLAVNLSLAQLTRSSSSLDDRSKRTLGDARALLQDMSRQIRTLSYLLHPPLLDELGLVSAVKEYALGFSERSGIQIQVGVSPGFARLPQDAETALFRIIQESLANIQRHSGSRSARIRLDGAHNRVTLEISDQGHGIPAASAKKLNEPGAPMGVGIAGMRERMAQLGGTLDIDSGKSGTTVRATLPVKTEVLDVASRSRG